MLIVMNWVILQKILMAFNYSHQCIHRVFYLFRIEHRQSMHGISCVFMPKRPMPDCYNLLFLVCPVLWAVSNKFIQTVVSGFASPHKSLILIWRFSFSGPMNICFENAEQGRCHGIYIILRTDAFLWDQRAVRHAMPLPDLNLKRNLFTIGSQAWPS